MHLQSPEVKQDLLKRLRRIEGQARGVQKMLEDDRDCREIVQQLNAIQAATRNATAVFVRAYAKDCLLGEAQLDQAARETLVDDLFDLMAKVK